MNLKNILLWGAVCIASFITPVYAEEPAASTAPTPQTDASLLPAPVRFILTFDDGPDGRERGNPTAGILDTLANNATQQDIKAIFFLQTRSKDGGATARGRELLVREHEEGHVLALHDGSHLGHPNHCKLSAEVLEQSLSDGMADLQAISGRAPILLRPPYWSYCEQTLTAYARHDLSMLLTDISANDGKVWGYHGSPRRRSHMASEMERVKERLQRNEIPSADGVIPIVVTFHDTNDYTSEHMQEYLQMLVDEAQAAGLALAAPAFYSDGASLEHAAQVRAQDVAHRADMVPGWWRLIHKLFG